MFDLEGEMFGIKKKESKPVQPKTKVVYVPVPAQQYYRQHPQPQYYARPQRPQRVRYVRRPAGPSPIMMAARGVASGASSLKHNTQSYKQKYNEAVWKKKYDAVKAEKRAESSARWNARMAAAKSAAGSAKHKVGGFMQRNISGKERMRELTGRSIYK